jgi:uncharacterized membrane protein
VPTQIAEPLPAGRSDVGSGTASTLTLSRFFTAAGVVYAMTFVYGACYAAFSAIRHESFNTARFDHGNMVQAVWNTAHGRPLESTTSTGETFLRLGAHVDPILTLFALPWSIWPNPLLLSTVQAFALAFGALPVFWLARKYAGSDRIAARFAFAYLLYPATQWNASIDFHPVSLAVPLLLFGIWYLDEDRLIAFLPFGILAAATKEHMPLLVAWLAVWYGVRSRRWWAATAVAAAGTAWSVLATFVLMPHYAPSSTDAFATRYSHLGGGPLGIAETAVTAPGEILREVATTGDVIYVLLLLAPLAGLWALAPFLALGAAPELVLDLLSNKPDQVSIVNHYSASIAPFLVAATALGVGRLTSSQVARWSVVLAAAASVSAIFSPFWFAREYLHDLRSPAHDARAAALALVPSGAAVSATNHLGAHLATRRYLLSFPHRTRADWVVVDRSDTTVIDRSNPRVFRRALLDLERDPRWDRVFAREGVLVYRRTG